jgi:hypothetical protein
MGFMGLIAEGRNWSEAADFGGGFTDGFFAGFHNKPHFLLNS